VPGGRTKPILDVKHSGGRRELQPEHHLHPVRPRRRRPRPLEYLRRRPGNPRRSHPVHERTHPAHPRPPSPVRPEVASVPATGSDSTSSSTPPTLTGIKRQPPTTPTPSHPSHSTTAPGLPRNHEHSPATPPCHHVTTRQREDDHQPSRAPLSTSNAHLNPYPGGPTGRRTADDPRAPDAPFCATSTVRTEEDCSSTYRRIFEPFGRSGRRALWQSLAQAGMAGPNGSCCVGFEPHGAEVVSCGQVYVGV
jgi:hypothetical protein